MQFLENITGIISADAERIAVEAAVAAGLSPISANNARIDLKNEDVPVTLGAVMWRAGRFPRAGEHGPFYYIKLA